MERDTAQRRAIRKAFEDAQRPLSPGEVLGIAQSTLPNLGLATVYRSLKAFVEESWLAPVDVPGEPKRYELAGKHHHHHFNCRGCGRMFDFDGCPDNMESLVPQGFVMEDHELFIYGRCCDCNHTAKRAAKGHPRRG